MAGESGSADGGGGTAGRAARIATAALLAGAPLVWLPAGGADAWADVFRAGVLGGIALVGLAAVVLAGGGAWLRGSPLFVPGLVLVGVSLVSGLAARAPLLGLTGTARLFALVAAGQVASLAAGGAPGFARLAARVLAAATLAATVLGTFSSRNDVASLAAAALVLSLAGSDPLLADRLLGAGAALALVAARTRGAWIGALAMVALLLVRRRQVWPAGVRRTAVAALVVAAAVLAFRPRMAGSAPLGEAASQRFQYARAALELFAARPVLGHGPSSYRAEAPLRMAGRSPIHAIDAHCDPAQALAETGAVGFLALLWWVVAALRAAAGGSGAPWAYALGALLVHGLVHPVFHVSATSFCAFSAAGLAAGSAPREGRPPRPLALGLLVAVFAALLLVTLAPAVAAVSLVRMERARAAEDWDGVVLHARRAVRLDPARPEGWLRLGEVHLLAGDSRSAERALRRAAFLAPGDARIRLRNGQARLLLGDREGARAEIDAALTLAPGDAEAREWRSRAADPVPPR